MAEARGFSTQSCRGTQHSQCSTDRSRRLGGLGGCPGYCCCTFVQRFVREQALTANIHAHRNTTMDCSGDILPRRLIAPNNRSLPTVSRGEWRFVRDSTGKESASTILIFSIRTQDWKRLAILSPRIPKIRNPIHDRLTVTGYSIGSH